MEPEDTRIEDTVGQTATEPISIETPAIDQADEAQVMEDNAENMTEKTAEDTSETVENIVEEAVVESTSEVLEEPVMESTEAEVALTTTMEQPIEAAEGTTCPLGECSPWQMAAIAVVILIVVISMIRLLKKKPGKQAARKPNGKTNGSDVVEIYVGNLSYDMNDSQLRKEFERFGVVKSGRVITHRTNNKSKGYGFVEMPHRKEAQIAIKALENAEVMGRRIRVNEARANTRPPER